MWYGGCVTFEEQAEHVIAALLRDDEIAFRTGLRKVCPTCKRSGLVFIVSQQDDATTAAFAIVWRGHRAEDEEKVGDVDLKLPLEALLSSTIGCEEHRTVEAKSERILN